MSKRTYSPTDYLQINNREILFGEKKYLIVFNESTDAIITFKTDLFFNKRGFLLFYRGKTTLSTTSPTIDLIEYILKWSNKWLTWPQTTTTRTLT